MKTIFLFLLLAVSANAQRPTFNMISTDFRDLTSSDTATTGLSVYFSQSGDTTKYVFTSLTHDQNSEVTCLDYDGGLLEAGDTLICTNVSLTMHNHVYTLQVPVNAIVSTEDDGTLILTTEWCILPLNGQSVYCHIVFEQNE